MSPQLAEFYLNLHDWIHNPDTLIDHPFQTDQGLCDNLHTWISANGYKRKVLTQELKSSFIKAYDEGKVFGTVYPFNRSGGEYDEETDRNRTYTNGYRLQWIEEQFKLAQQPLRLKLRRESLSLIQRLWSKVTGRDD